MRAFKGLLLDGCMCECTGEGGVRVMMRLRLEGVEQVVRVYNQGFHLDNF